MESVPLKLNACMNSTIGFNQRFPAVILQMTRLPVLRVMVMTATTRCLMVQVVLKMLTALTMRCLLFQPTAQLSLLPVSEQRGLLRPCQLVSHLREDPTSWIGSLILSTPSTRLNVKLSEPQLCSSCSSSSYSKVRSGTSTRPFKRSEISWKTLNDIEPMPIAVWIGFKTRSTFHRSSAKSSLSRLLHIPTASPLLLPR